MADAYLLPKVTELKGEFKNREAVLSWNKERTKTFYSNYIIERSEDGTNYRQVHDKPFISLDQSPERSSEYAIMLDSLPANNTPYFYRVKGRTIFGEYGPPSDPVQGMGIDPMPTVFPKISGIQPTDAGHLVVNWGFEEQANGKISGFQLYRSSDAKGTYDLVSGDQLIPVTERFFIDRNTIA